MISELQVQIDALQQQSPVEIPPASRSASMSDDISQKLVKTMSENAQKHQEETSKRISYLDKKIEALN